MDVHCALHHGIGRLGVHEVENTVDNFIAAGAEHRRTQICFVSASMTIFMNPWVSLFSTARATCVIARLPTSKRFPVFRASASDKPARPTRWCLGGDTNDASYKTFLILFSKKSFTIPECIRGGFVPVPAFLGLGIDALRHQAQRVSALAAEHPPA